ncbi:hypothetical protein Tco_1434459, partial [Tanacetum coccineum]
DIARVGFSLDGSVNKLISDGVWRWPLDWLSRFPIMAQLQVPLLLDDIADVILWRDRDGVCGLSLWLMLGIRYELGLILCGLRNGRLFKKKTSSPDQIVDVTISMVMLKLVTFKFKKMSTRSRLLLDQWKIPSYCIVHDGSSR